MMHLDEVGVDRFGTSLFAVQDIHFQDWGRQNQKYELSRMQQ